MFKTSVYISNTKELSEEKAIELVESKSIDKKIEGMKELIMYVSQGKTSDSILHTVVKEVLLMENNELKRLLYYFLEIYVPLTNEGEILLLNNQIRKDLESPNEFVRGLVLKFVSTLRSVNVLNNCYKSIKENTTHSVGYVRRNAYFCLGMIYLKIGIFEETPKILTESLYKEMDIFCLVQAFSLLWDIDSDKALTFAYEVGNTKGKEFLLILIDKISDETFLKRFVEDQDGEVRLEACLKLIEILTDKKSLGRFVDIIFQDIKEFEDYYDEAFMLISKLKDTIDLSHYAIDVLNFINPFNLDISKSCVQFAFNVCKSKDITQILQFTIGKYKEIEGMLLKSKALETMLIDNLSDFISRFGMYNEEIKEILFKNIRHSTPALAFSSLLLLNIILEDSKDSEIINSLIKIIPNIKYGKILRFTFNMFANFANFNHLKDIYDFIDSKFKSLCQFKGESDFIIFQKDSKFLISFVCISLTEISFKNTIDEEFKSKLIALFLGFTKLEGLCDSSTKSTIFLCIRSLAVGVAYHQFTKKKAVTLKKTDVLEPLEIPFLNTKKNDKLDKLAKFLGSENINESLTNVVQLTGLSDPIYVEAGVLYTRYEIILNILLINQTDNYLQNMLFDFGTSQNIRPISLDLPGNMKGRSAISKKLVFRVLDSSSGFINGSVTFKYPNESGEYANQNYTLNFSEIKTDVSDFLEVKSCKPDDFKTAWKKMVWENVYSIKVLSVYGLRNVFDMFIKFVSGTVVDFKEDSDILVANIMCTTRQNEDIFFNVCIAKTDNFINLECRIRSSKEDIVKSMSNILGRVVKEVRIK